MHAPTGPSPAILCNGKDRAAAGADAPILFHTNIRGRDYYN
jgi:hypothetical protein